MADGLPALSGASLAPFARAALLVADALEVLRLLGPSQWGVFGQDGQRALNPKSVVAVRFRQDQQISDYPVEEGGFMSYNKVATPFEVKVTMTKDGSDGDRGLFLAAVDAMASDLNLYSVVMPDGAYPDVNLSHYDFERTSRKGVGLLTVDAWFTEVRLTGAPQFQQTAQPSGADPVNVGTVQPQAPGPQIDVDAIRASLDEPPVTVTPL